MKDFIRLSRPSLALAILALFGLSALSGCVSQPGSSMDYAPLGTESSTDGVGGTLTGNPQSPLRLLASAQGPGTQRLEVELCLSAAVAFERGQAIERPIATFDPPQSSTLRQTLSLLAEGALTTGSYERVELRLSEQCGAAPALVHNRNGTFRVDQLTAIVYRGTFTVPASGAELNLLHPRLMTYFAQMRSDLDASNGALSVIGDGIVSTLMRSTSANLVD